MGLRGNRQPHFLFLAMKKTFLFLCVLLLVHCHFIDPELNVDPNRPATVSMAQLLPVTQVSLAYCQGGVLSRYATTWMQQTTSFNRSVMLLDKYQVFEGDMDFLWATYYAGILSDLRQIQQLADDQAKASPHYGGIAKVLEAMVVAQVVDLWSDIPYSEALQGAANTQPAYDPGATIYDALLALLDEALLDLDAPVSACRPGADDLIYGGDLAAWKGLAHLVKARLHLHLSQYDKVLETLDAGGLTSIAQNAMVYFGNEENAQNPWFQFNYFRGDIGMCSVLIDRMHDSDDPRLPVYASLDEVGEYSGNPPGEGSNPFVSKVGSFYASPDSPVPLALYPEQLFMEAEAALETNPDRAASAFNAGVVASLAMFEVDDPAYLASYANETAATLTLEKIAAQKYIALFTMPEIFSDWRRTGLPGLVPVEGFTQIARRFSYPSMEQTLNAENCPDGVTLFDRVFWDE